MLEILCIIPARSGSKGIINKNIKFFRGKPLLIWSIEQALSSKYKMEIVVSTDSDEYKKICDNYLKDSSYTPFLRPTEISGDLSTDFEFMKQAVDWYLKEKNKKFDIILQLRPTSPLRKVEDIDKALDKFIENREKYDSLRSVIEIEKTPYKMYKIDNDDLVPFFNEFNGCVEPYNLSRQLLPKTYLHNGYIDILNCSLLDSNKISGENILPYVMDPCDSHDIDSISDFNKMIN